MYNIHIGFATKHRKSDVFALMKQYHIMCDSEETPLKEPVFPKMSFYGVYTDDKAINGIPSLGQYHRMHSDEPVKQMVDWGVVTPSNYDTITNYFDQEKRYVANDLKNWRVFMDIFIKEYNEIAIYYSYYDSEEKYQVRKVNYPDLQDNDFLKLEPCEILYIYSEKAALER